jgi:hypothetical protein
MPIEVTTTQDKDKILDTNLTCSEQHNMKAIHLNSNLRSIENSK